MIREKLSEREKQIAAHIAAGLRVAGVAQEFGLAENTVRNHLKSVFSKLDVHTQSELIEHLRSRPSAVAPYNVIAGLPTGTDRALHEELAEVDRATETRIEEIVHVKGALEGMKQVLRAVLPIDEVRRRE
ncbi:MAG: response regulator transcription factor [Myxococcota bacterium]